jgi:peptidoglycan/xylan/chitin deacetylase (PgdA/CDA1 family)
MEGHDPLSATAPLTRRDLLSAAAAGCALGATSGVQLVAADPAADKDKDYDPTLTPEDRIQVDPNAISLVTTTRRYVAITFDDGPDPDYTPAVLAILRRYAVTATFFVVGSNATAHPDLIAAIHAQGHALANHTQNHRWLNELGPADVMAELKLGRQHVLGSPGARLYRPPRGWTSPTVAAVASRLALRPVYWSDCIEAHHGVGARATGRQVGTDAVPGSIILTHDGGTINGPNRQRIDRSHSVESLPYLLQILAERSLTPVTVPTLLASAGGPGTG